MTLVRWQPLREIDSLQRELNRLFDSLEPTINSDFNRGFTPAIELEEDTEAVHLRLELPGFDPKDLDIQVTANSVSIVGERKLEQKNTEKNVHRSEFRYGKFQRIIPLPIRVQNTQTQAEYKDGILHLTLPKAEDEKNKVVKVNLGN